MHTILSLLLASILAIASATWLLSSVRMRAISSDKQVLINDGQITTRSSKDVLERRRALIHFVWGSAGFPDKKLPSKVSINIRSPVSNLRNLQRVDEIRIAMEASQEGLAHHFIPVRKNSQLVILHQGHECTLNDTSNLTDAGFGVQRALDALLYDGYSVLGMYMPGMRPDDCRRGPHDYLFNIATSGSAMKFFLEPVAVSINYLKTKSRINHFPEYDQFHMVGFSGGGWTTTVYAAIDPTIRFSFAVAGSIPLYLRFGGSIGDLEQTLPAFYQTAGYLDLYVMGSFGLGRKQVQILNRYDDCCFGERQHDSGATGMSYLQAMRHYATQIHHVMVKLGSGQFRLEIDETAPRHMISYNTTANIILSELQ